MKCKWGFEIGNCLADGIDGRGLCEDFNNCPPRVPVQPEPQAFGLLTESELKEINDSMPADAKYGDVFKEIAREQHKQDDREHARWVEKFINSHNAEIEGIAIKIFDELEKPCPHVHHVLPNRFKAGCDICLIDIKKKFIPSVK